MAPQSANLFEKHGDDWPEKYPECAKPGQSPINLRYDFYPFYLENDIQFSNYEIGWTELSYRRPFMNSI